MLGFDIVVESHIREGSDVAVTRGDALSITEQGRNDYEVLFRVEGLVGADEPFVVGDGTAIPGGVEDCGEGGRAECFVGDEGGGEGGAGL